MANETPPGRGAMETARTARRVPRSRASAAERARMGQELRDVDFPVALRGYDRDAVDRYVQRVNRLIAELEVSASPESAVRHALEEVTEETRGLLERAHETAEEITARSRARADDRLQQGAREAQELRQAAAREVQELRDTAARETKELRDRAAHEAEEVRQLARHETQELREAAEREAKELTDTASREARQLRATAQREAEEMRAAAEARVRELDDSAEILRRERRRLIEDVGAVAERLRGIAETEAARFPLDATEAAAPEEDVSPENPPRSAGSGASS